MSAPALRARHRWLAMRLCSMPILVGAAYVAASCAAPADWLAVFALATGACHALVAAALAFASGEGRFDAFEATLVVLFGASTVMAAFVSDAASLGSNPC